MLAALFACLTVSVVLVVAIINRSLPEGNLPAQVAERLPETGVSHAVTAVLLDFRSYDTLLEVAVLLVAVVVAMALREAQPDGPDRMGLANPLLRAVVSWLLPLMLLVAAYLLWAGSSMPGGAFQAGAVLAAAGVLLRLAGVGFNWMEHPMRLRVVLAAGLAVFVAVGTGCLIAGRAFLDYPPKFAGSLILFIECAVTLSIALALVSLLQLAPPQEDGPLLPERRRRFRK
nr:MnhB domain-containing protein [Desulfobulbus alkaliphilus]